MKKNFLFSIFVCFILICFSSCSTPNLSPEEYTYSPVIDKEDLVGSWATTFKDESTGLVELMTLTIYTDYKGYLKDEFDYSNASSEIIDNINLIITKLRKSGYTVTNNNNTKKLTAIMYFSSSQLTELMALMEINDPKTIIKISNNGQTAYYEKQ